MAANSTLTTQLSGPPYYDDYDKTKNYYRFLFRPGLAVQARELTQMQTMVQSQIDRFGKHIFQEGSIVLGGQFGIETDVLYVKVKDLDNSNNALTVETFEGEVIRGANSNITAYVVKTADGAEANANTKTLFVRYTSANATANITGFSPNEVLISNVGTAIVQAANATGYASVFTIDEGVFFAKEHFISFKPQSVVLDRYSTNPTCQVGFNILEEIVDSTTDTSLLDPAQESSNYSAPGADRLKLTPTLVRLDIDTDAGPPDYTQLLVIKDGVVQEKYQRTQYSVIKDELAKRTFDESGDYYVNGFDIRVREHKDTGNNGGYLANGNTSLLAIGIEPGTGYVKGYEINTLVTKYLETEKAIAYANTNSEVASTRYGNYLTLKEFVGAWPHDTGTVINLYDTAMRRISNSKWSTSSQLGNLIGTAKVKCVEYDTGTIGTANGTVNLYLMDIQMLGTNSFSNVRSVYYDQSTYADMGGDVVLDSVTNTAVLQSTFSTLLYYTGVDATRTLRDSSGNPDMTFTFKRTTNITISANGTFNLPITTGSDEVFPYGTGSLTSSEKQEILLNFNEGFSIAHAGVVAGSNGSNTLTGTSTAFTRFNVGDKIEFSNVAGPTGTYIIAGIGGDTSLTLTTNLNANASSNAITKVYKTGDLIDLTGKGVDAGTTRTVSATPTALTVDLKETLGGTKSATVSYQVTRTSAREIRKTLKAGRWVQINCASSGTSGPFNLGFPDIYRVRQIRKKTGTFAATTDGTDVTDQFIVDNGQRDEFYDLGSIIPNGVSLANTDYLLAEVDYFAPDFTVGIGYFSVDSYPVDDANVSNSVISTAEIPVYTSPINGIRYDLRNMVDFRPVKTITANDTTSLATATLSPARSNTFNYETNGLRLPAMAQEATYDYSYYLSRIDVVAVDKNGTFSIIKGEPAALPITPKVSDNLMSVAKIYITPYPSISPYYGIQIGRRDLATYSQKVMSIRYTMRDIGVLKNRIENLEYYSNLNALENEAINFRILDDNGLDRFKNGIFVDTFADYRYSDITDLNYRIIVDPKEKSIRPLYTMDSLYYEYLSGSGVQKTGDLVTLPYTSVVFLEQPKATTTRNIETTVYRFIGNLYLSPDTDSWVDTQQAPDNHLEAGPTTVNTSPISTTWNAWQTKVTGYELYTYDWPVWDYDSRATSRLAGTFNTYDEAMAAVEAYQASRGYRYFTTLVKEIGTQFRTGSSTFEGITSETQELNQSLIDVDLQIYIRPQHIKMLVRGLKPGTRFYTFFDGEDMSDYVSQFSSNTAYNNYPLAGGSAGTEGDPLISDSEGVIYAVLRIPNEDSGKRFRVGTKEVKITDSPTNEAFATSYAISYFVAQGLIKEKQRNILTTRKVVYYDQSVAENGGKYSNTAYYFAQSCMAYSFLVSAPENEEGLFITGFDVYVAAKHATKGVWFELREMDSGGGITRTAVPFSEVWLKSSDVTTSDDGSEPLHVDFNSPIFLYNNTQYALVIHTEGINPDYYFYVSRLGGTDIATGDQVTSRALTGTLYTTNNNLNWIPVPELDLKVKFYRASFTKNSTGTGYLGNQPYEFLTLANTSGPFTRYGEKIAGLDRLTLTGNTANVGDLLIGQTSNVNTAILSISGSTYYTNSRGYIVGETVVVANANGTIYGANAVVATVTHGEGVLSKYSENSVNAKMYVASSNGNYLISDKIEGAVSGEEATITSIDKLKYSVIDFEPAVINFNKTECAFQMKVVANAANAVSDYFSIVPKDNYTFIDEKAILSRSWENSALSGDRSNQIKFTMRTTTDYLSPVLDVGRTHSVYVYNMVNSNTTNETSLTGGALINKYISQPVILAEGQDAEDMSLLLTCYRPFGTDVKVWVRISHAEDADVLANKGWIELECSSNGSYSTVATENFIEYYYKFPASSLTGTNGEVEYTNVNNVRFTGYKYFQVKIGLLSDNSAIVPRVADLRVIALQK